ncbi:MAG: insulinase family protein, partial [Bacteroidota bacterium]
EKVLLDSIENMFEHYRTLKEPEARKAWYAQIDQVSNEASKLAIANEYDKLLSLIGATRTNAYTTEDRTVYMNEIPSNQIDNFFKIEGNRFRKLMPRLFHTELEAVYEEKNRSLDNDGWKASETMSAAIFAAHPYGTQTVIGTIEHLKNPSITEILKYFNTYYVPNNVAICVSGDIDYAKTIATIDQYFGDWQPNENLPTWNKVAETPITAPIVKEVVGPSAESISMGFRFDGRNSADYPYLRLIDYMLSNSEVGLIDLNLKQKQLVLNAGSYVRSMNDYSVHTFSGTPREGQSLEEVKDLLLAQIEKIKAGDFEDWLIDAVINNLKKGDIQSSESNYARASDQVMAFTNDIPWNVMVNETEALSNITKEDLVKFANENYKDNYVAVFKNTGTDENALKVEKPEITKVALNRDAKSDFYKQIENAEVAPLKPVFVDYQNDIKRFEMNKGIEVVYNQNVENKLFNMYYFSENGRNSDPMMAHAIEYLDYLGTDQYTSEEIKKEFYKLGCSYYVSVGENTTYIGLSGIAENMDKAMDLMEGLLSNPVGNEEALAGMKEDILKNRENSKKSKGAIMYRGLMNYGMYGANSPFTNVLSNKQVLDLTSEALIEQIKSFTKREHKVLYYGPLQEDQLLASLNDHHLLPDEFLPPMEEVKFDMTDNDKTKVYWTDYDMVQAEIAMISKGAEFDVSTAGAARLYNSYFGGGMNSIVFQEIREAQGLAYSASSSYIKAGKKGDHDFLWAYVGTQADKQDEAMQAMLEIINDMPKSESALQIAKKSILSNMESQRTTKASLLFSYINAQRRGLDYDLNRDIYRDVQNMSLEDIEAFQEKYIKGQNYNIMVLGSKDKLDFKALSKYGDVKELSLEELFGYDEVEKLESM